MGGGGRGAGAGAGALPGGVGGSGASPGIPMAGAPGARAGSAGGGRAIKIERQRTSKTRLKLKWDFPVYKTEAEIALENNPNPTGTVGTVVHSALPREKAFYEIAGDDPRPLLVLRECQYCNGTDDALLSRTNSNEKTLLMSQWFHCVKLPNHVLEADHSFRELFGEKDPPHLFVCSRDGSNLVPLRGDQSRTELWDAMLSVLEIEYRKDPEKAVREITKLLAEYDHLDSMEDWKEEQIDAEIERKGPKSNKLKKLRKQLEDLKRQKAKALEREKKWQDLGLIRETGGTQVASS